MAVMFLFVDVSPEAVQRTGEVFGLHLPDIVQSVGPAAQSLGIVAAICATLLILCYFFIQPMVYWMGKNSEGSARKLIVRALEDVASGMRIVGNAKLFWGAQLLSFQCWIVFALSPIPLLMAFSMDLKHAILNALSKTAITTIAQLLPSAPGTIGTFHAFCLLSVLAVNPNMDKDAALAYVLLAHIISTLSPALPGLLFVPSAWKEMLDFRPTKAEIHPVARESA